MSVRIARLKRGRVVVASVATAAVLALVAFGMGSAANAAPGGNKGKPTPTPTVSQTTTATPSPTTTTTPPADPAAVSLNCYKTNGYVVVDYSSGVDYSGAELYGAGLLLGTYLDGSHHLKFTENTLPSSPTTLRFIYGGQELANCMVNLVPEL